MSFHNYSNRILSDRTATYLRIICDGAAIAAGPTGRTELVSDDFPVSHWRHDARIS